MKTIKEAGYEAIIINNNPETVSTDYTTSDKLYFEPLCVEDVMNVIEMEKPDGIIASLGGQTAINLANPLQERGVKLIGTDCAAIEKAENRKAVVRAFYPTAERTGCNEYRRWRKSGRRDRLSGAGTSKLCTWRKSHADRGKGRTPAALSENCGRD